MTYYGAKELAASFRTVRSNTMKIAEEIPESQYGFRATPELRTVGETLVHIAVGTRLAQELHFAGRLKTLVGFDFFGYVAKRAAEEKAPRSKDEIVQLLRDEGDKFAKALEESTDEFLGERVEYPPEMKPPSKSRFEMLLAAKEHEMHHRGQLMMVERMLGITPHLTRQMEERVSAMRAAQGGG